MLPFGCARLAIWSDTLLCFVGQVEDLTLVHGDVLTLNLPALLQSLPHSVPASDPASDPARYQVHKWLRHKLTQGFHKL